MSFSEGMNGYYGEFGGAFVPELLRQNIIQLEAALSETLESTSFQSVYRQLLRDYVGRPSPLYFAERLSEELGVAVYLKREDLNHTGSHKINNALGQVLIAKHMRKKRIIAETGAGQHGVAVATVCARFGIECVVYMGALDCERQAANVARMRYLGASVRAVETGTRTLKDATNEALRDWIAHPADTYYLIGSAVGPHPYPYLVAQLQSVISSEIRSQFQELTGAERPPACIVACVGGGSNAIGAFFHFLNDLRTHLVGIEAAGQGLHSRLSAATLTLGLPGVLHGSRTIVMQDEDGQITEAHSISAGLDYPGVGPQHAHLFKNGRVQYKSVTDVEALSAAAQLTRLEGIIPALESAHALAYLPVLKSHGFSEIVVCLSGRGDKDLPTYLKSHGAE